MDRREYKDLDTPYRPGSQSQHAHDTLIFIRSNPILNFIIFRTSEIELVKKKAVDQIKQFERFFLEKINCYNVEATKQEITTQYMVHEPPVNLHLKCRENILSASLLNLDCPLLDVWTSGSWQKGLKYQYTFSVTNAVKNRLGDKALLQFCWFKRVLHYHLGVCGHLTGLAGCLPAT